MALVDTFQLVHNHSAFGVNMVNVYHALRNNPGEVAQDINDSWVNSILPTIRLFQSAAVTNNSVTCFNLGDEEDFHTQDLAAQLGLRSVSDEPSFLAAAIRFPSLNRAIRSGQKRYVGLGEADMQDGTIIGATVTLIENIGDDLIGDWLASADSHVVANLIVVQRVCDEVDPSTGECLQYRLPESDGELKFYQPTSRLVNSSATSQVSRKTF